MQGRRHVEADTQARFWVLAVPLIVGGCERTQPQPAVSADTAAIAAVAAYRPECPQHTGVSFIRKNPRIEGGQEVVMFSQLTVPGLISTVPEFHDCQRFILQTGDRYGPLVAIWASASLDSLWPPHQQPKPTTLPLAEILSYDGDYAPLWIRKNFSCLYIIGDSEAASGYSAYIWWVDEDETKCGDSVKPETLPGVRKLTVSRTIRSPRMMDYPTVARWDWDPVHRQQYIGIRCGAAWCSVSAPALNESPDYDDNSLPMTDEKRVHRIKGWYDEQRLAVQEGATLRPEEALATVIPDGRLHTRNKLNDFRGGWIPVARIAFSSFPPNYPYQTKLGFTATSMGQGRLNRVEMCLGLARDCLRNEPIPTGCTDGADAWWAKIRPADAQAATEYRCVVRHDHSSLGPSVVIPATARWRWLADDETLWVRCAQGCCTVTGK